MALAPRYHFDIDVQIIFNRRLPIPRVGRRYEQLCDDGAQVETEADDLEVFGLRMSLPGTTSSMRTAPPKLELPALVFHLIPWSIRKGSLRDGNPREGTEKSCRLA